MGCWAYLILMVLPRSLTLMWFERSKVIVMPVNARLLQLHNITQLFNRLGKGECLHWFWSTLVTFYLSDDVIVHQTRTLILNSSCLHELYYLLLLEGIRFLIKTFQLPMIHMEVTTWITSLPNGTTGTLKFMGLRGGLAVFFIKGKDLSKWSHCFRVLFCQSTDLILTEDVLG